MGRSISHRKKIAIIEDILSHGILPSIGCGLILYNVLLDLYMKNEEKIVEDIVKRSGYESFLTSISLVLNRALN